MESAFTVTIPVRINKIAGSALLGTSWPTSMISVSFAQRLKLTVMPPNNQEDRVHRTSSKTYGRAIVRIETGGLSANLLVNIVDLCVDALLGLDALSEFQAVIQIGVHQYPIRVPHYGQVQEMLLGSDIIVEHQEMAVINNLQPSCAVCSEHSPQLTIQVFRSSLTTNIYSQNNEAPSHINNDDNNDESPPPHVDLYSLPTSDSSDSMTPSEPSSADSSTTDPFADGTSRTTGFKGKSEGSNTKQGKSLVKQKITRTPHLNSLSTETIATIKRLIGGPE